MKKALFTISALVMAAAGLMSCSKNDAKNVTLNVTIQHPLFKL